MKKISYIIPCYRSASTIVHVLDEIDLVMKTLCNYEYEIILINDFSPDNTDTIIKSLSTSRPNVIGVFLSKNFGQHAAIMAGMRRAKGDIVVCLDDDGQTPANEVGRLLTALEEGYDAVYAKYETKQHGLFRNLGSILNDRMAAWLLGKPRDLYVSSYFAVQRFIVDEIIRYTNPYPYIIGLVLRSTSNITNVPITHRSRDVGQSGYTLGKLVGLWINGFTSFSVKPLRVATLLGLLSAFIGFGVLVWTIINKIVTPEVPLGYSSTMAVLLFLGGIILVVLGLLGEYVGRLYISANHSPQYVVKYILDTEHELQFQTKIDDLNN